MPRPSPCLYIVVSDGLFFYDGLLAAVVAAFAAYGVVDVPCTAVGAECQCGGYCLVVGTTLCCTGLRLLAFRMCHCFAYLSCDYSLYIFVGWVELFQSVPAGVGASFGGAVHVFHLVDEFVLEVGVFIVALGAVLLQQSAHLAVALAHGVDVLDGYRQHYGVVNHIGDIESGVAHGYLEHLVIVVVLVFAVFHHDVVGRIDGEYQIVQAAVTQKGHIAGHLEVERIEIAVVHHRHMGIEVGIVDVFILHVLEEALVQMKVELMRAGAETFQG